MQNKIKEIENDPLTKASLFNSNSLWKDPKRVEAELKGINLIPHLEIGSKVNKSNVFSAKKNPFGFMTEAISIYESSNEESSSGAKSSVSHSKLSLGCPSVGKGKITVQIDNFDSPSNKGGIGGSHQSGASRRSKFSSRRSVSMSSMQGL